MRTRKVDKEVKSIQECKGERSYRISTCEIGKQPKRALELSEAMQRQDVVHNFISCNALISTCEKGRQSEKAVEVFEAMQRQDMLPHVSTYISLICAYEKSNSPERAWEVLEAMQRQRVVPDVIAFSALFPLQHPWEPQCERTELRSVARSALGTMEEIKKLLLSFIGKMVVTMGFFVDTSFSDTSRAPKREETLTKWSQNWTNTWSKSFQCWSPNKDTTN